MLKEKHCILNTTLLQSSHFQMLHFHLNTSAYQRAAQTHQNFPERKIFLLTAFRFLSPGSHQASAQNPTLFFCLRLQTDEQQLELFPFDFVFLFPFREADRFFSSWGAGGRRELDCFGRQACLQQSTHRGVIRKLWWSLKTSQYSPGAQNLPYQLFSGCFPYCLKGCQ